MDPFLLMGKLVHSHCFYTVIESEGVNLSVGERSLLSPGRALVKYSKLTSLMKLSEFFGVASFVCLHVEILPM